MVLKFVLVDNFVLKHLKVRVEVAETYSCCFNIVGIIFHFTGSCTIAGEFVQGNKQEIKIELSLNVTL